MVRPAGPVVNGQRADLSFKRVQDLFEEWAVRRVFRAAYKPRGNGIVECHHRWVKKTRARRGGSVNDAVNNYNFTPRGPWFAVPMDVLFGRKTNNTFVKKKREELGNAGEQHVHFQFKRGDRVVVWSPLARCDTPWQVGHGTSRLMMSPATSKMSGYPEERPQQ